MKKIFVYQASIAIALLFVAGNLNVYSQQVNQISAYRDCTPTIKFFNTDTILVVIPDTYILNQEVQNNLEGYTCFQKKENKPAYAYKHESELTRSDMKRHILLYGSYTDFKRKEFMHAPVKKAAGGFKFHDRIFDQEGDAFFYINTSGTRMYVCKNSARAKVNILSAGLGAYPMHIFRNNKVLVTGVYM